jgi:hypothetical protein
MTFLKRLVQALRLALGLTFALALVVQLELSYFKSPGVVEFDCDLLLSRPFDEVSLGVISNGILNKSYDKFMALEAVELIIS